MTEEEKVAKLLVGSWKMTNCYYPHLAPDVDFLDIFYEDGRFDIQSSHPFDGVESRTGTYRLEGNHDPLSCSRNEGLRGNEFGQGDREDHRDGTHAGRPLPMGAPGSLGLGNFVAVSQYGTTADSFFTATNPRAADGQIDGNITSTIVPVGSQIGTPEPATLALAGLGLPLVGLARVLRRKAAAA